jgi:hypothetical protein
MRCGLEHDCCRFARLTTDGYSEGADLNILQLKARDAADQHLGGIQAVYMGRQISQSVHFGALLGRHDLVTCVGLIARRLLIVASVFWAW